MEHRGTLTSSSECSTNTVTSTQKNYARMLPGTVLIAPSQLDTYNYIRFYYLSGIIPERNVVTFG